MGNLIHLTAEHAAQISGPSMTAKNAILTPVPLTDGTFIVGLQNIDNLAFADRAGLLASFPQVDYSVMSAFIPEGSAPVVSGAER